MDAQIKRRLTRTADHYLCIDENGFGDKVYDPPVTRACFQDGTMRLVKNAQGEEVTSTVRLIFDGLFPLTAKDKIRYQGTDYAVINYRQFDPPSRLMSGITEVYL